MAARERDDVLHGEEVRLVVQLRDERQLVLDVPGARPAARPRGQRRRAPSSVSSPQVAAPASPPPAPARADTRSAAHRARSGSACASSTLAASSCGGYSRASRARSRRWRSPLGYSREPGCAIGTFEADGRQRILQLPPGAHVHVHVAAGDERHAAAAHRAPPACASRAAIRALAQQLDGDAHARREALVQPVQLLGLRLRRRQPQDEAARGACGLEIGARQRVPALGGRAPAAADQAAQARVAGAPGGERHEPQAAGQAELRADDELQLRFLAAMCARTTPATEHSSVRASAR